MSSKAKSKKKGLEVKQELVNVQDLFINGKLSKEDYDQITTRYKLDLAELNTSLEEKPAVNDKELYIIY